MTQQEYEQKREQEWFDGFDLYNFIQATEYMYETEHRPMYLVQGDEVGKGSTNEPLLRNVKIIKVL